MKLLFDEYGGGGQKPNTSGSERNENDAVAFVDARAKKHILITIFNDAQNFILLHNRGSFCPFADYFYACIFFPVQIMYRVCFSR